MSSSEEEDIEESE